jgi:hypothetical protein
MSYRRRTREIISGLGLSHGVSSKERVRLILLFLMMAVVTVALAGGMDSLFSSLKTRPSPSIDEPSDGPVEPVEIADQVPKWDADPAYFERAVAEGSSSDRIREYPDALRALAELVRRRPHVQFLLDPDFKAVRGFLTPKPKAVFDDPKAFRAKPVEFNGVLEYAELADTKVEFGVDLNYEFASQWIGRVRLDPDGEGDPRGRVLTFLFLDDVGGADLVREHVGRRVKLQGVFYRLRDVKVGDAYETTLFVLGKKMVRALNVPVASDPAPIVARIKDETETEQRTVYDDAFYAAFGYAFGNPPEATMGAAPPRELAPKDGWEEAEALRLKPVRVKGAVLRVAYESFESEGKRFDYVRPDDAIASGWYTTYLGTLDADAIYVLGTKEKPQGISVGSRIEAEGLLYKRLAFDNRGTARPEEAPPGYDARRHGVTRSTILFCPKPFVEIEPPQIGQTTQTKILILVPAVLLAGLFALLVARDGAGRKALAANLRLGRKKRLRAAGGGSSDAAKNPGGGAP